MVAERIESLLHKPLVQGSVTPKILSLSNKSSDTILPMKYAIFLLCLSIGIINCAQAQAGVERKPIKEGFVIEAGEERFNLPQKVVIQKNGKLLMSDKVAKPWNTETDGVRYFNFGKDIFLIASEWDTGDFTSFRLFHLGSSKDQTKEYKIMGAVEDENGAVFFKHGEKLYYWERSFCDQKKVFVFDDKKLEFISVIFTDLKGKSCLPDNLELARKQHEIKQLAAKLKH